MHDLVTYHNDLSCLGLREFSAMELDVLMSLLRRCRDKGTSEITIDFLELKEFMNIKRSVTNEEFSGMLISMNRKLLSLNMMISEECKIYQFTLFTCFGLDTEEKTLEITVNQRFSYLINSLTSNFTTFELEQFVNLRSTYSKEFYRLLKRFKNTGVWKVAIEKFESFLISQKDIA